ncbi:50S ribosome-binding GTPase domain-containing protein [Hirsutella rhossiliensis]
MFLPLRQLASRCRPKLCRTVTRHAISAPLSTSAADGARHRPSAHRRPLEPDHDARQDSQDGSIRGQPEPSQPRKTHALICNAVSRKTGHREDGPDRIESTAAPVDLRPTLAAKGAPLPVVGGKESLASYNLIRQGPGSPLTTTVTKEQVRQFAAAQRFFEHGCDFLYSAEALRHHPRNEHVPEIVVLGASNVGKSSFLNALVGREGRAKVGQRPGKTKLMNAFGVGPRPQIPRSLVRAGSAPPKHSLILVDTPGYGYRSQAAWGAEILKYLEMRQRLRGAVVLLSLIKRQPSPEDLWVLRALAELNTRTLVVVTKADRQRPAEWPLVCSRMADAVLHEMDSLDETVCGYRWRAAVAGAESDVYVTAAGMDVDGKLGNGAGMGGVRAAILQMAGFDVRAEVTKTADNVVYAGPTVSFDDIQWG